MDQTWQSLKGKFLIAMPGLADPNFYQSVTCLSEHNQKGAMGIVITRTHPEVTGKMIFDELQIPTVADAHRIPVYIGGPVHANELFILHGEPFGWEGSMPVTEELALSNSRDILEAIAMGKGPRSFIIALGCAGWGPGQLEGEIRGNAWITCPYSGGDCLSAGCGSALGGGHANDRYRPGTAFRYTRPCLDERFRKSSTNWRWL